MLAEQFQHNVAATRIKGQTENMFVKEVII